MGFFSFRREQVTDDDLRDALFAAAAASDIRALKKLASRHLERVVQLFPTWKMLPPDVRSDPTRTRFWAEGVIGVASAVAELGDQSEMQQLQCRPVENVMVSWQQALVAAQADVNVGNYVSAIQVLEQALDDAKEMVAGTAIDDLLPKTFGLLGTAYYRAGDRNKAREYTLRAREHCARIGDEEGRDIYTRNLETIGAPAAIAFRDAQGRLLTADELRAATGTFRYEVLGGEPVPAEANALHQQGREVGARGQSNSTATWRYARCRGPRLTVPDRAMRNK